MSGVTGLAPLTGLSSLLNTAAPPDAGTAARAGAAAPATDGERPRTAETARPVARSARAGDPPAARPESRGSPESRHSEALERGKRDGDARSSAADRPRVAARGPERAAAGLPLPDPPGARPGDGPGNGGNIPGAARLARFLEALQSLRTVEPADLTPDHIAAVRAAALAGPPVRPPAQPPAEPRTEPRADPMAEPGAPVPDPAAPLVGDGLPKPVKIEVPDLLAEAEPPPVGRDDGVPSPVEPLVAVDTAPGNPATVDTAA